MKNNILHPDLPINLLNEINKIAIKEGIKNCYLVGGAVRDGIISKLPGAEQNKLKDIDILIEGSAIKLANKIKSLFEPNRLEHIEIHESFNTAEIIIDGVTIDLASARTEIYPIPGDNPIIKLSNIDKDLARRDFTINAMAIEISSKKLIDLYQGQDSILKKELDFIHSKSVKEDPTRIIRAARYASRLKFSLSSNSLKQIKSTLKDWPWSLKYESDQLLAPASLAIRLRFEIEILLKEETWEQSIDLLQKWGGLVLLDSKIQNDLQIKSKISLALKLNLEPLYVLISTSNNPINLANRLKITLRGHKILKEQIELEKWLEKVRSKKEHVNWSPSQWCQELEAGQWSQEAIALAISLKLENWETLLIWLDKWRHMKSPISAQELIKQGWEPGPKLGTEIARLRKVYIDSQDKRKKEEN